MMRCARRAASGFARLSEALRQKRCEFLFGTCRGELEVRLAERVDQCANDMGSTQDAAGGCAHIGTKPIQVDNLPVEQDDRDLGSVNLGGPPPAPLRLRL